MPTLHSFFKDMEVVMPREGLEKQILQAVLVVQNKQVRRRLEVAYIGITVSLGILLYTGFTAGKTLYESDFWNIVSIAFSDMAVVANFWSDFLFSLLETFPAFSVAAVLFPIFILFIFLNMYAGTQRKQFGY